MSTKKTWLITGASKGLGLALVNRLLQEGYRVVATSRTVEGLKKAVNTTDPNFLPLAMDLLNETDVAQKIAEAVAYFGSIDVVVNNAGYGQIGGLEELSDTESRDNFDVNVFGSLNVIRKVLPYLRAQKSGHIFNISSIGGFTGGFPAFGIYCASKFAVHGFTESLYHEAKPFGIDVTLVMPGYFRTNFLGEGSIATPKHEIEAYQNVREVQLAHQNQINATQPGDPDKAAAVMINVAQQQNAPLHLFLGEDAYKLAEQKIELVQKDMDFYRQWATATAFND